MADSTKLSLIMGARNGALEERDEYDFYATDPKALELFLNKFNEDGERLADWVWEPACGNGHLSKTLKYLGYYVYSSDIIKREYDCNTFDFLVKEKNWGGDILTNPPYKYAKEFVLKALDSIDNGQKVIMFLKCQFLEEQSRYNDLFSKHPPKYVYVHSGRQNCAKDGNFEKYKSATLCYCWFVWQKGFKGETILRWIP